MTARPPSRAWPVRFLGFLIGAPIAFILLGLLVYRVTSLPSHDGELRVRGLNAAVTIERDADGVAHITAQSEADALFALGYVHMQDRTWQMDFNRHIAQGRISEIAGRGALPTDRFLRVLSVRRAAQATYDALDAETQTLLEAYSAGVNAYLANRSGPMPPEFLITGAADPEPWTPLDSLSWALMMAWDLSQTYRHELQRLKLAQRFSVDEINDLRPPYPGEVALPTTDYVAMYRLLGLASKDGAGARISQLEALHLTAGFGAAPGLGSNNWVLAGARTQSGRPLVANDPHLGLTVPSVWYMARLKAPGLDVFGATLPGVPYVLLGRTRQVAWGFTNTGPDVQDLYIERLHPEHADEYATPTGHARFETREEILRVKGAEPERLVVRRTRHGPVISDVLPAAATPDLGRGPNRYVIALRWAALDEPDTTMRALRAMNRARDAREFADGLRAWTLAQQNIVFADERGDIGMIAPGRVPIRDPRNDLQGLAPAPGWDARYDWQGWIAFDQLPRVINPPSGVIVSANHRITPPGYRHFLTSEWEPPFRARRIEQRILAQPKHDAASLQSIQADVLSLAAVDMLEALRPLDLKLTTEAAQLALQRLLQWDGRMGANQVEPVLYHAWMRQLRQRIFGDDLRDLDDLPQRSEMTVALHNVLRGAARSRDWCDDRATTQRRESCAEIAGEALEAAITELATTTGKDVMSLRWGELHRARLEHRPLSNVPALARLFELRADYPGDTHTINVGALSLQAGREFSTRHAASYRAIYDLADGSTRWIYGGGQVGHPMHEHYGDLLDDWAAVRYRRDAGGPPAGARPATILRLTPSLTQ